ncbi:MAG: hypothetical protein Kow0063_41220 [Anaerolineae bacterium]
MWDRPVCDLQASRHLLISAGKGRLAQWSALGVAYPVPATGQACLQGKHSGLPLLLEKVRPKAVIIWGVP